MTTKVYITPSGELVCARRILWADETIDKLSDNDNLSIAIGYEQEPMWLLFQDDNGNCALVNKGAIDRCIDLGEL